jgi:uncharacterized protein YlzI (FlbEa/FlbD family)
MVLESADEVIRRVIGFRRQLVSPELVLESRELRG